MKKVLIIFGPTVTGKTSLAIELAKKFNGEIISTDSRQVYKNLDIGTGKVSFDSKTEKHDGYWIVDGVKTHGFDIALPGQSFSVANFLDFSSKAIKTIYKQNKMPIVVGGTGFYIKSLLYGIDSIGIAANKRLRKSLEKKNIKDLYKKLKTLNPTRAESMNASDRANPRRLIRAIEIATHASTHIKSTANYKPLANNFLIIGLTASNKYLYNKADKWLELRIEKGLFDEVKDLLNAKVRPVWLKNLGLEYRWATLYLTGEISENEAVSRLKGDIHHLIRRQKTFFNQFEDIQIYDITKNKYQNEIIGKVEAYLINEK